MGLLKESDTCGWEETVRKTPGMKKRGTLYFAEIYNSTRNTKTGKFLWGDEIEKNIIIKQSGRYMLLIVGKEVIEAFAEDADSRFNVEYAGYMVESTPNAPYSPTFEQFEKIEGIMEARRKKVEAFLRSNVSEDAGILFLPSFPLLGTPFAFGTGEAGSREEWEDLWIRNFEEQAPTPEPPAATESTLLERALQRAVCPTFAITRSIHFPDFAVTSHKRFQNFSYNIRERRGRPLNLEIPVHKKRAAGKETKGLEGMGRMYEREKDFVGVDSMGQGMGCCCLQVTMQCESMSEARLLYDVIGSICPLLLSLTMATSILNGKVVQTSTRWEVVSASVDCRKKEEEGYIRKSRYSSIDLYTSEMEKELDSAYNDIEVPVHMETQELLQTRGVDFAMARHVASLYIRDPVLCYKDSSARDDFENIQSSNWRSMRLKLPPEDGAGGNGSGNDESSEKAGWLVETRPMEIQPTSFENSAYTIFVVLFSRMVLSLRANFYIPISKVDDNFRSATHNIGDKDYPTQDTIGAEPLLWYRTNIFDFGLPIVRKGTFEEIFFGDSNSYCGIFGAIDRYLTEYENVGESTRKYMSFLKERVRGEKTSTASFLRKFVFGHPEYRGDGGLTEKMSSDLVSTMCKITERNSPEYLCKEYQIDYTQI